ncbi:hypothetical protein ACFSFY_16230 [Sporosarcina siberiensis]|uniref:ABC-2 type transport system permease protein n=1 Tax=Sporosarcina siberiensis TaxID=1365606 RepID=A0ABW4SLU7_9BACL
MSEDKELMRLEKEWEDRFDRFTAPEPSREQTLNLIQKIKGIEEVGLVDVRIELERHQDSQTMSSKVMNLFLSGWNFHGARSWLFTGILMFLLTLTVSQNTGSEVAGFTMWIKGSTLIMIAVMSYAFRTKNEGNQIIETLSYYPLIAQLFMRFMIVMVLQLAITLPLSFVILGGTNSIYYLLGSFTPVLFFGVIGFVSTIWFGQKISLLLALIVWFSQTFFEKQLLSAALFQLPGNEGFLLMNSIVLGISILLLGSVALKNHQMRDLT